MDLSGEIERTHQHLSKLIVDLENLDRTLPLFDPDYPVESIKPKAFRPPDGWSNRGEMTRVVLRILRQAAEPLTTRDIDLQLIPERAPGHQRPTAAQADVKAYRRGIWATAGGSRDGTHTFASISIRYGATKPEY